MENTTLNHINVSNVNFKTVSETIEKIKAFVKEKNYQFKDSTGFDEITETKFNVALSDMSKKKRKRLARYLWSTNTRPSLEGINKFFHFFMKNVLKSDVRIRVIHSAKEIAIQDKRKVYKEALAKAKAAYADYKTEKGDFYKKNQSI